MGEPVKDAPALEMIPRTWRELRRGLGVADAPAFFQEAVEFYRLLREELDEWGRANFTEQELRDFARSRRNFLHTMLDRALDVVEIEAEAEAWPWP